MNLMFYGLMVFVRIDKEEVFLEYFQRKDCNIHRVGPLLRRGILKVELCGDLNRKAPPINACI